MDNFQKGDIIVVVGIKDVSGGTAHHDTKIAEVVEVGNFDLFAVSKSKSIYKRPVFRVPKSLCQKVTLQKEVSHRITYPQVGDFVMSITQTYTNDECEKVVGILNEIVRSPWNHTCAKLLIGDKYHEVPYDSLIILER
jgi:uncharacterized protein (UPF0179 family)